MSQLLNGQRHRNDVMKSPTSGLVELIFCPFMMAFWVSPRQRSLMPQLLGEKMSVKGKVGSKCSQRLVIYPKQTNLTG